MKESYYATHQAVAKYDPKALWIEKEKQCFILSTIPIFEDSEEIDLNTLQEGMKFNFTLRFNGVNRIDNKETRIFEKDVMRKIFREDSFKIEYYFITREKPIYMEEKKHVFYPYLIEGELIIQDIEKFKFIMENGFGRAKRLGFGMIFIF